MWLWDDSIIGCERRTGHAFAGPKGKAFSDLNGAIDDVDDCDSDTVLEMYHYTNGTFLELNGFLEEAIGEYREAVEISPDDGFYRYNLGVALLKDGQFNEAFKELTESLRLDPDNCEARCALADVHGEMGLDLEKEGRLEEAAREFREAIAIDPEYPAYYASLGRISLKLSLSSARVSPAAAQCALDDAVHALRLALCRDPECVEARLNLGIALVFEESGRALDEGISVLSSVLQTDPLNDEARSCLDYARKLKSRAASYC